MKNKFDLLQKKLMLTGLYYVVCGFIGIQQLSAQSFILWKDPTGCTPGPCQMVGTYPGGTVTLTQSAVGNQIQINRPATFTQNLGTTIPYTFNTRNNNTNFIPAKDFIFTFSSPVIVDELNIGDIRRDVDAYDQISFNGITFSSVTGALCNYNIASATGTLVTSQNSSYAKWKTSTAPLTSFKVKFGSLGGYTTGALAFAMKVTMLPCIVAPLLDTTIKTNFCPGNTIDLTSITASNQLANTYITYHTGTPANLANKVANPNAVPAGIYYAAFYDVSNDCYSSNATPITAAFITCIDTDGDGISDSEDMDDDNDGILDTDECIAEEKVAGFNFDNNGNNLLTNSVTGWNLTGGSVYSAAQDYIRFEADNAVQTINQTVNNISGTGEAPAVNMQFMVRNYNGNNVSSQIITTITYAGTIYATLTTDNGLGAPTFAPNNGAIITGTVPFYTLGGVVPPFVLQTLILPNTVPKSGNFEIKFDSNGPPANKRRDDIILNLFSIQSCADTDGDGDPDHIDVDSDSDLCPDAIEGSENINDRQVYPLNLGVGDPNYARRGQIKVIYNAVTVDTPANIISNSPSTLGVPQLVNSAGSNLNTVTNPANLAGVADNTDVPPTADIGQGIGASQDALIKRCVCHKPPSALAANQFTKIGISTQTTKVAAFPETVPNGFIALESTNKGLVITRTTTAKVLDPKMGMIIYDTANNCVSMYNGSVWKCIEQSCND